LRNGAKNIKAKKFQKLSSCPNPKVASYDTDAYLIPNPKTNSSLSDDASYMIILAWTVIRNQLQKEIIDADEFKSTQIIEDRSLSRFVELKAGTAK